MSVTPQVEESDEVNLDRHWSEFQVYQFIKKIKSPFMTFADVEENNIYNIHINI